MCGRFNITDDPALHALLDVMRIPTAQRNLVFTQYDIRPTQFIDIILPGERNPSLAKALWWLILKKEGDQYKPDTKWASFNSRYDKFINGKVHQIKPQSFRVIIPASSWYEWQGEKGSKVPYMIKPASGALALGGVAKRWETSDGPMYSASIITLPGHPKLSRIHEKSMPLILQEKDYAKWLDRSNNNSAFSGLLRPHLPLPLVAGAVKSTAAPQIVQENYIPEDDSV
ncbi:SOS response-associated peptidase [Aurantivibrio plasticivorans]